jgi:hypothetical protein
MDKAAVRETADSYIRPGGRSGAVVVFICVAASFSLWAAAHQDQLPRSWVKPGELSRAHATLMVANRLQTGCQQCHDDVFQSRFTSLSAQSSGGPEETLADRCVGCHQDHVSRQLARYPHSASAAELGPQADLRALTCGVCHQEHRGLDHDLTAITSARCQVCHQRQFRNFADHPEFVWKNTRGAHPIRFDHAAHASRHFGVKGAEFDCRSCHLAKAGSDVVLRVGFDQCANCHRAGLEASLAAGLPALALPMIDVEAMESAGLQRPDWPVAASGDFDGRLPPLMIALLASDPELQVVWKRFGYDFDLIDADPDDPEDLKAVQQLAGGIKRLMRELSERGQMAAQQRVTEILPAQVAASAWRRIFADFASDVWGAAFREWFAVSVALRRDGRQQDQLESPSELSAPPSSWRRDDESCSVAYYGQGHADPFLRGWIELFQQLGPTCPPALLPLRDAWLHTSQAGQCVACHSVNLERAAPINWTRDRPRQGLASLTRFDHRPHLRHPDLSSCVACHRLADVHPDTASFMDDSFPTGRAPASPPAGPPAGLVNVTRQSCVGCHHRDAAGEHCTQCHTYHIDVPVRH